MVILPAAKRIRVADLVKIFNQYGERSASRFFCFETPRGFEADLRALFTAGADKSADQYHLTIARPKRPRSGKQNRGLRGWCADIAQQLAAAGQYPDFSLEEVKERVYQGFKRMAVSEAGWPTVESPIDGSREPMSESFASVEQDTALINIVKRFADQHGLWLVEIVKGPGGREAAVRCLGGVPVDPLPWS